MNLFLSPTVIVPSHIVEEYGGIESAKAVAAVYRRDRVNLSAEELLKLLTLEAEFRYEGRMTYSGAFKHVVHPY